MSFIGYYLLPKKRCVRCNEIGKSRTHGLLDMHRQCLMGFLTGRFQQEGHSMLNVYNYCTFQRVLNTLFSSVQLSYGYRHEGKNLETVI